MAFSDKATRVAFSSAFQQFPVLQTERLILNEVMPEEAEEYHRLQRSALDMPQRPPWDFGMEAWSVDHARDAIRASNKSWKKKSCLRFAVRLKPEFQDVGANSAKLIGLCALFDFENQYKAEIGYWLGADYHNQGFMTEAVRAVVAHVFGTMHMGRLYARTSNANLPSITMLIKVGFVKEGVLRRDSMRNGNWDDTALMAILKTDFDSAYDAIKPVDD